MSKRLHLRNTRQRGGGDRSDPPPDPAAQVERIDALIRSARTSWFGLLSYLAFVGVTLLGVEDADFFMTERQTDLPLIGVSIPTLLFFWVAPTLGAALYAYFHLHLLKLYEALGRADRTDVPLADRTQPWLVADLALSLRPGEVPTRPMRWLALGTAFLLAYLAGPLVLAGFWFRSMPYHGEWLTIVGCGIPLMVSLYTIGKSLSHLRAQMRPDRQRHPLRRIAARITGGLIGFAVVALGWLTTEGSLEGYMRKTFDITLFNDQWQFGPLFGKQIGFPRDENGEVDYSAGIANPAHAYWWGNPIWNLLLFPADLAGVDFVDAPPSWREHDTARAAFRVGWCEAQGVPTPACGPADRWQQPQVEEAAFLANARADWCAEMLPTEETTMSERCDNRFSELEAWFRDAWTAEWQVHLGLLTARDLARADLRGADLGGAQLQGARLGGAQLQGARLGGAQLQGADLFEAELQGADLGWVEMSEETDLTDATLRGASVRSVDDTTMAQLRAHGDWPEIFHPDDGMDYDTFIAQWRAFAAALDPPVTIAPDYRL